MTYAQNIFTTTQPNETEFVITWTPPYYVNTNDVKAEVNEQPFPVVAVNGTTVTLEIGIPAGAEVRIYRETDISDNQVNFLPGSPFRAEDVNANFDQLLFALQEAIRNDNNIDINIDDIEDKIQELIDLLNDSIQYVRVFNVAELNAIAAADPDNLKGYELVDSTGVTAADPEVFGIPPQAGGDAGEDPVNGVYWDDNIITRLVWDKLNQRWLFVSYYSPNADNRYQQLTVLSPTEPDVNDHKNGTLWFNETDDNLYILDDDGVTRQWVTSNPIPALDYVKLNPGANQTISGDYTLSINDTVTLNGETGQVNATNVAATNQVTGNSVQATGTVSGNFGSFATSVSSGTLSLTGKGTSAETVDADPDSTLVTKGYVDFLGSSIQPINFDISITGSNIVGQDLVANTLNVTGGVSPGPTNFVWYVDGVEDVSATTATRTNLLSDTGSTISCAVTVSEPDGSNGVTKLEVYPDAIQVPASIDEPTITSPEDGAGLGGDQNYFLNTAPISSVSSVVSGGNATVDTSIEWTHLAGGNGRFLMAGFLYDGAMGTNYLRVASSTDGANWTIVYSGNMQLQPRNFEYSNSSGFFTLCELQGSYATLYRSTDGVNWESAGLPGLTPYGGAYSYYGGVSNTEGGWVGYAYGGNVNVCSFSNTWNVWSLGDTGASNSYKGVAFGAGKFVMVGNEGASFYSTDGTTYTTPTSLDSSGSTNYTGVQYLNNQFFVSSSSGIIFTSNDGVTYSNRFMPNGLTSCYRFAGDNANKVLAVCQNGTLISTNNGASWTKIDELASVSFEQVAYANGIFVVLRPAIVNGARAFVKYSPDGTSWGAVRTAVNLADSNVYRSDTNAATGNTIQAMFAPGQTVQNSNNTSTTAEIASVTNSPARIVFTAEVSGWTGGDRVQNPTQQTEYSPSAANLTFTSTAPSGDYINSYGNAVWEVSTDVNFTSPQVDTKAIVEGTTQTFTPADRTNIALSQGQVYYARVRYESSDPNGVSSSYSSVVQFETSTGQARAISSYYYDESTACRISDADIISRYGVNPSTDLIDLGIYPLSEQPSYATLGYLRCEDEYEPLRDYSTEVSNLQALVSTLTNQIQALQAAVGYTAPTPTPTPAPSSGTFTWTSSNMIPDDWTQEQRMQAMSELLQEYQANRDS